MPYGTDAFTDGYGDFKQPTVIDYDKSESTKFIDSILSEEDKKEMEDQFKKNQQAALDNILSTNPYYAGDYYRYLVFAKDNKLVWDVAKIHSLKEDVNWLYTLSRYLDKKKKQKIIT